MRKIINEVTPTGQGGGSKHVDYIVNYDEMLEFICGGLKLC
jgi:hypothetical protein